MNDFTEEELFFLRDYTEYFIHCYDSENAPEVLEKIQSMIDNYCEHDLENYCCGCDPENIVCKKCHRDLWGNELK